MKTVSKSELKAHMLEYFRRVEETGEELVVTSHKMPTLKVVPVESKKNVDELFSGMRNVVKIHGDLTEPETEAWGEMVP
jgi:prevent-host-death family protein